MSLFIDDVIMSTTVLACADDRSDLMTPPGTIAKSESTVDFQNACKALKGHLTNIPADR